MNLNPLDHVSCLSEDEAVKRFKDFAYYFSPDKGEFLEGERREQKLREWLRGED